MARLSDVEDFLSHKRIAFVGVSRNPKDFSRAVFKGMREHGFDLVPVNPSASDIDGVPAYATLDEVPEGVDGALLMTPASATLEVVEACVARGIPRVWMHQGAGPGAVSTDAVARCHEHGIKVIDGQCPLMFLGQPAWVHRLHAWGKRLAGSYPQA